MSSKKEKSVSPIKVNDYFANPLHKIRQPTFVNIGFNQSHLNTFVKAFTNRHNQHYLDLSAIKKFITSFSTHSITLANNNPKLISTYQDFFLKNFPQNELGIEIGHFIDFFVREEKQSLNEFDIPKMKKLFNDFKPLTQQTILQKCEQLNIPISNQEAKDIIKYNNYSRGIHGDQLAEEAFISGIEAEK